MNRRTSGAMESALLSELFVSFRAASLRFQISDSEDLGLLNDGQNIGVWVLLVAAYGSRDSGGAWLRLVPSSLLSLTGFINGVIGASPLTNGS